MDMYLSAQDGFNLQEMLDYDIKCEMDDSFGFNAELPPLDIEDDSNHAWIHANSNSSFELDFFNGDIPLVVNPSSVLPFQAMQIKKEKDAVPDDDLVPVITSVCSLKTESPPASPAVKPLAPAARGVPTRLVDNLSSSNISSRRISTLNSNTNQLPTTPNNNISSNKVKKTPVTSRKQLCMTENICYPKPAYSYSCLIAMALKNSRSGSLPVSEIYNFMCTHFPYFKTAPNGWKNSVRHNLSLNKCFEKIEKPVSGPGGTQRKGCLWAMNPAKITKMDDEVAKWSRRDPLAIKKAMLNPENLELLERGEMKIGRIHGDSEGEVDTEEEVEELDLANQIIVVASETYVQEERVVVEEEDDEEEEEEDEEDDDEPQPISSDDSDDELSHIPPSLQPFEPRLALLNRHLNDSLNNQESGLPNEYNIEVVNELNPGYEELGMEESRAFLGLDVNSLKFVGESDDEESEEELINRHIYPILQEQQKQMPTFIVSNGKKRKMTTTSSPSSIIQGNYVCVKRKLKQPSIGCRSVN